MRIFVLSYWFLFCCVWLLSLVDLLLSERKQSGRGSGEWAGEGELGGLEGGNTVVRIYCMKEESVLHRKN